MAMSKGFGVSGKVNAKEPKRVFNELFKTGMSTKVVKFMETNAESGVVLIPAIILSIKQYNFKDADSGNTLVGVTFSTTDGLIKDAASDEKGNGQKGLTITNYSASGLEMYREFDNLPDPPYLAILQLQLTKKKTILQNMFPVEEINKLTNKDLNIPESPNTTAATETKKAGGVNG